MMPTDPAKPRSWMFAGGRIAHLYDGKLTLDGPPGKWNRPICMSSGRRPAIWPAECGCHELPESRRCRRCLALDSL